jgi:glycosyltransferase involved in cell wall biosynthesis
MKIIHFSLGKANPESKDVVNKVIYELASTQVSLGYSVEFWGITHNPTINFPERNFETSLFQDQRNKFRLDPQLEIALDTFPENEPVIFHLHGGFIPQLYSLSRLLKSRNLQYIITPHGSYNTQALKHSYLRKKVYSFLFEKALVKQAAYVHLIGESEVAGTLYQFGIVPIKLISYGQTPIINEYVPEIKSSDRIFGYAGRLDAYGKGLTILLKAFALYCQSDQPKAQLQLIGSGNDQQQLIKLCKKLNIEDRVCFLGALYGNEKWQAIAAFDFFILPSRNEGMPSEALEALSLGIPCIVSKQTNLGTVIRDTKTGIELKTIAPEAIMGSLKLANTWSATDLQNMKERCKRTIITYFDWKNSARELTKIYRSAFD